MFFDEFNFDSVFFFGRILELILIFGKDKFIIGVIFGS